MPPDPTNLPHKSTPPAAAAAPHGLAQRLLAEAMRIHEQSAGPLAGAAAAEAAAQAAGGGLERRIIVRALALDQKVDLASALGHVWAALNLVGLGMLLLGAIGGAGAGQAALGLGGGNVVNFFVVLVVGLGLETAMLLLWLMLAMARSGRATGLIGRIVAALAGHAVRLAHTDARHVAAARALGGIMASTPFGRWTLGAITHGTWLAYLAALLAVVLFLLSTRSYVFVWETTILSADTYVPLTSWLAAGPGLFGFTAPTPEEIRASQWLGSTTQAAVARDAWAHLLVGCIVVYGIVPRFALLILCLALRWRAARRFRLDTARPGYAQLAPRLMPAAVGLGFADSEAGTEPRRMRPGHEADAQRIQPDPAGPIAVMGLELDVPAAGWPPPFGDPAMVDLGLVQGRRDFRMALDRLRGVAPAPRLLVLVCALTTTPDRGLLAYLDGVTAASAIPMVVLLTGGQRLRERLSAEGVETRLRDWRALAREAGVADDAVVEIDLDNLTDRSRDRLRALADGSKGLAPATGRLEHAFAIIRSEAAGRSAPPDVETQAELHRKIARLYDGDVGWQRRFDPRELAGRDLATRLRSTADAIVGVLPGRLALDPRWLTAGALAGALGCVAAATLAAPVAISGLPLWAGLGAAIASAVRGSLRAHGAGEERPADRTDAVKAAALFALVLEAQGHGEAAITRLIDAAIGHDEPVLETDTEIAAWLDDVCRRYRDAEAREGEGR